MSYRFLIVGTGFSGSVLARELVSNLDCQIDVWEKRNHLAGNCYTCEDKETGIMVHQYGPHIFNTNNKEVWDYFNRISPLHPYVHRVKALHNGKVYPLPVNLATLNQFFNKNLSPVSARKFFDTLGDKSIPDPGNFEEQANCSIGKELYQAFFYGYTKKQWGCEPRELPASILKRLPVRFNYDDNYHKSIYTGIPEKGYTDFVEKLLNHSNIHFSVNRHFILDEMDTLGYDHIFYTGPLDEFFNFELGRLSYRTLRFEKEVHKGDFQGCAQMNYCDEDVPYTRITEHKYFTPWKEFDKTIIFKEYSTEATNDDILYYPKRLRPDKERLREYRQKASTLNKVSFLGRLGTYRYLNMDQVIGEAIRFANTFIENMKQKALAPVFPNEESI